MALLWDDINETIGHKCQNAKCVMLHTEHLHTVKNTHLLDPIMGITKLIKCDWGLQLDCNTTPKQIIGRLKAQRKSFWDKMENWLELKKSDADHSKSG